MKTDWLHHRWGRFAAVAGVLLFLASPARVRAEALVGAVATGGDRVVQLSGDSHDIVHAFAQDGTFTLSAPSTNKGMYTS